MALIKICNVKDIAPGQSKSVQINGEEIGLFMIGDKYYAIENTCPHREGYLHEGELNKTTITCPWHFSVFDLKTGEVLEGPAEEKRKTYKVVLVGDEIKIDAA